LSRFRVVAKNMRGKKSSVIGGRGKHGGKEITNDAQKKQLYKFQGAPTRQGKKNTVNEYVLLDFDFARKEEFAEERKKKEGGKHMAKFPEKKIARKGGHSAQTGKKIA